MNLQKNFTEQKNYTYMDCSNRSWDIAQVVYYDSAGEIVATYVFENILFEPVIPDSVAEGLLKFICSFKKSKN